IYYPFFKDFGPLDLGLAFRFCRKTAQLLQEAESQGKHLIFFTGPSPQYKANAAVLVGIFQVMLLQRSAERVCSLLQTMEPFLPFRDPSRGPSCFDLQVYDCVRGIAKAKEVGFLDWHLPESSFNLAEYEHYEQVENGDLNWIVPGKLLAFSGPSASPYMIGTYTTHTPEDYHKYFSHKGITAVVRLNNKLYDGERFTSAGFNMHELFFSDGSCPSEKILQTFLHIAETENGALAVHCKAGLGRTGVLICAYMMKHYGFTPEEAMGYIRICRPGSVIGPQQNFLIAKAKQLQQEGRAFREARRVRSSRLLYRTSHRYPRD
ncbi:cell division cycle protein 14, partial [Coccomyxa subellipsoidea C-169]